MFVPQEQSGMNDAAPAAPRRPYRLTRRPEERVRVLGGVMDLVRPEEVFHFVTGKLEARQSVIVANHNLHSLYLIGKDHQVGAFYKQADLIEVDSVPLIFWARLVGRASRRFHRCTYLDWRDDFWSLATRKNWKVFFVGGARAWPRRPSRASIRTIRPPRSPAITAISTSSPARPPTTR